MKFCNEKCAHWAKVDQFLKCMQKYAHLCCNIYFTFAVDRAYKCYHSKSLPSSIPPCTSCYNKPTAIIMPSKNIVVDIAIEKVIVEVSNHCLHAC